MKPVSYRDSQFVAWAARLAGPAVIAGAALTMLWLSWGKWPDALNDFGREIYVPWMLAEGKILYRDLLYFNPPLSQYWNAWWFSLFGSKFSTLVWVNIALLSTMILIMYRVLREMASPFAASVACLAFISEVL